MPKHQTAVRKRSFLEALGRGASVTEAAICADIQRRTAYYWRRADPEFSAAWEQALASRLERLEEMAFGLALEGNSQMIKFLISRLAAASAAPKHDPAGVEMVIVPPSDKNAQIQEFITVKFDPS